MSVDISTCVIVIYCYFHNNTNTNTTINTKVGFDLPTSEQVRQSHKDMQVTLNEGKMLVNTKGVYGSKFGNETHFLSFVAIVASRNGPIQTSSDILISDTEFALFIFQILNIWKRNPHNLNIHH